MIIPVLVFAQEKNDTSNIYYKLQQKSYKHKSTRLVYDMIFENIEVSEKDSAIIETPKKYINPFIKYKGKIVRNINIVVLDPFGYSVNEFYAKQPDYLDRTGNKFHVTTKEKIINNILLFKSNTTLDPLELSESERLLRLSPYIYDARIYVFKYKEKKGDSVDVMVVVQDRWTTLVGSKFDLNSPDINITEKNILGFGHQYTQGVAWNSTDQYVTTYGRYSIFNIQKTFISAALFYSTTKDNKQFGVSFDRPFYSPLAKWAGGISVIKTYTVFQQTDIETGLINKYPLNYNNFDFWGAKSFPLTENKSASIDKRSSNFIVGARYFRTDYLNRPSFNIDSNRFNRNLSLYLINFGFSRRKYYRDRYLFRFGANEDIPEGLSIEVVLGAMKKELTPLWYYSGIKFGTGKHIENIGYLSIGASYGTFYNQTYIGTGVINIDALHFTDLIKLNRWYFRQFSRINFVEGIDRASYEGININGSQMNGFSSAILSAKSKMILNFEFVLYAPYKIIGFQFAPVFLCGFAGLGNNFGYMFSSPIYQAYALGILIRNEYLISNTFQLSIGLYPYMPGNSDYTIKLNPITNYDLKARDYFISKPDLVSYQ